MFLLDAQIKWPETFGTFTTSGDQITSRVGDRIVTDQFWFESGQLVEREGPESGTDTFHYKRYTDIACK